MWNILMVTLKIPFDDILLLLTNTSALYEPSTCSLGVLVYVVNFTLSPFLSNSVLSTVDLERPTIRTLRRAILPCTKLFSNCKLDFSCIRGSMGRILSSGTPSLLRLIIDCITSRMQVLIFSSSLQGSMPSAEM